MTRIVQISDLPLAEFSEAIACEELPSSELRSAIELFTHKVAVDQYGKDTVDESAPAWEATIRRAHEDGGMSEVESVERIAHLALVLLGKFDPDDSILFLSPSRISAMAFGAVPLSIDQVSSMVPVSNIAALEFNDLRALRNVKRVMSPTVKVFAAAKMRDEKMDRWSKLVPLIP